MMVTATVLEHERMTAMASRSPAPAHVTLSILWDILTSIGLGRRAGLGLEKPGLKTQQATFHTSAAGPSTLPALFIIERIHLKSGCPYTVGEHFVAHTSCIAREPTTVLGDMTNESAVEKSVCRTGVCERRWTTRKVRGGCGGGSLLARSTDLCLSARPMKTPSSVRVYN